MNRILDRNRDDDKLTALGRLLKVMWNANCAISVSVGTLMKTQTTNTNIENKGEKICE